MAEEKQPAGIVEGATAGDAEEEVQEDQAKSAEDRKAAAALSKLDARGDDGDDGEGAGPARADQQQGGLLSEAVNRLSAPAAEDKGRDLRKVKVDAADVALLVDELDLTKPKATDLLKQHDGDAVKAIRAFIAVN